ncbi:hypothetical protein [Desulfoscipio gibsoniae]
MIFSLLCIGAVLVIVVFVVIIAATELKAEKNKGEREVVKNIYIYLVLFATLMMTIGGSVGVFMAIADIVAPVPYHQTFEEFKRFDVEKHAGTDTIDKQASPSEEELKQQYEAMVLAEKEKQANRAKNNLIKSFGWIIIPLPVFIYFQRRLVNKEIS